MRAPPTGPRRRPHGRLTRVATPAVRTSWKPVATDRITTPIKEGMRSMALNDVAIVAGTVSTFIFVGSYLPMLVKAIRTRDLSSYSALNLVLANVGNAVHSVYVFSLPAGPLWVLHSFYLVASALMLAWWARFKRSTHAFAGRSDQLIDKLQGAEE